MKRILLSILVCSLFVLTGLLPASNTYAQSTPSINVIDLSYSFANRLNIKSILNSPVEFSEVFIVLQPEQQTSRLIKLVPDASGHLDFDYDLNKDPLKPFARVYYWYQFISADGAVTNSPSFWFDYIDNRFEWKNLSSKLFEIYWTGSDTSLGQKVQSIASTGLERATQILPVAPVLPIRIYVYPNPAALQDTLTSSRQEWIAGHASPELGVVLVSDGADTASLINLEQQISHEMMHILQYQLTGSDYGSVPAWILEGLSTYAENYPDPDEERILSQAYENNSLLDLNSLCHSLPIENDKVVLGYAQSFSVVKYIQSRFGGKVFIDLLEGAGTGLSCQQQLETATGISFEQLEEDWKTATFQGYTSSTSGSRSWLIFPLAGLVLILVAILVIRLVQNKQR